MFHVWGCELWHCPRDSCMDGMDGPRWMYRHGWGLSSSSAKFHHLHDLHLSTPYSQGGTGQVWFCGYCARLYIVDMRCTTVLLLWSSYQTQPVPPHAHMSRMIKTLLAVTKWLQTTELCTAEHWPLSLTAGTLFISDNHITSLWIWSYDPIVSNSYKLWLDIIIDIYRYNYIHD